jgi:hypothetical protein
MHAHPADGDQIPVGPIPDGELSNAQLPRAPASPEPAAAGPASPPDTPVITEFRIGDEFGTAKRSLPPAGIVIACIVGIAIVVGIFALTGRAKPQGAGAINFVTAVDVPGQNIVMAAITFTLRNTAQRPLWVHTLKAELTTADNQTQEDEAASVVDLERYFQAFPALKESSEPPLSPETKMLAGTEKKGTIIVTFKVSKEIFDQRKSLTVSIQPYDQPLPVVLK